MESEGELHTAQTSRGCAYNSWGVPLANFFPWAAKEINEEPNSSSTQGFFFFSIRQSPPLTFSPGSEFSRVSFRKQTVPAKTQTQLVKVLWENKFEKYEKAPGVDGSVWSSFAPLGAVFNV